MDIETRIWEYIDGKMSKDERRLFEQEMIGKKDLARLVGEFEKMHSDLQTQPLMEPGVGFTDRVMEAIPVKVSRVPALSDQKIRKYLIAFLTVSLLCLFVVLLSNLEVGQASNWRVEDVQLPSLSYGFLAAICSGPLLLLVLDHFLLRHLQNK